MARPASDLESDTYLRLMVEAASKAGKTRSIGHSLIKAFGLVYIIECGTKSSLEPLYRQTKKFDYVMVREEQHMEDAIKEAKAEAKKGKYKAIFLDDFNLYGIQLHEDLNADYASKTKGGEADGRKVWWEWRNRMGNTINRLMDAQCHFVMACHPQSFMGKAGAEIPGSFSDVVYMRKDTKDRRIFEINCDTEEGRGCRSVEGEHKIDADVGAFWKLAQQAKRT